jgi:hypothetical protein
LPRQAVLQQTPSAQKPVRHWLLLSQGTPSGRGPQLPALQLAGLTQSASEAQTSLQTALAAPLALTQMEGLQVIGEPVWQVPLPSQLDAGTSPLPPAQAEGPQPVPDLCRAQPPRPLQVPSWPQVPGSCRLQKP